jgi:hypothetical protein
LSGIVVHAMSARGARGGQREGADGLSVDNNGRALGRRSVGQGCRRARGRREAETLDVWGNRSNFLGKDRRAQRRKGAEIFLDLEAEIFLDLGRSRRRRSRHGTS